MKDKTGMRGELYSNMIHSISYLLQSLIKHKEMKNKDKVTLKGEVDKPEVFQHWTEDQVLVTANNCKELKNFNVGIDPYHIEPIDNPQKPKDMEDIDLYMSGKKDREEITVMEFLKMAKRHHPEVLEQFIKEHYGK